MNPTDHNPEPSNTPEEHKANLGKINLGPRSQLPLTFPHRAPRLRGENLTRVTGMWVTGNYQLGSPLASPEVTATKKDKGRKGRREPGRRKEFSAGESPTRLRAGVLKNHLHLPPARSRGNLAVS